MLKREDSGSSRRGYVLVMLGTSLATLLGLVGLAVDVGRMYVVKSESQSFADAASFNAVAKLAITPGAYTAAASAAAQTPKKWEMGTRAFTSVTTTFSITPAGPFVSSPPNATYKCARVVTSVSLPLYFLPPLIQTTTATIAAAAVAGQLETTTLPGGEFPFSPMSRKNNSPDSASDPYGYQVGNTYTFRWGSAGGGTNSTCDGGLDESTGVALGGTYRGYCCEDGNSATNLAKAIMLGGGTVPVSVGQSFPSLMTPGQKTTIDLTTFINFDTDTTSLTYSEYKTAGHGNGKRLVIVPVNDHGNTVAGFAEFFLLPAIYYPQTPAAQAPWCAEYVGAAVPTAPGLPPGGGSGLYHLKLYK